MRIVLLGTGNLATRLGIALHAKHAEIVQVYGRSGTSASDLANLFGCTDTSSMPEIITDADLYILAVSDTSIPEVLTNAPFHDRLIVHTSGSISIDILSSFSENYGVFYPLQTLSKQKAVDFSAVPICIEANNAENLEKLNRLAKTISDQVFRIDSAQRRELHLAAVFVCNFVNHFYAIGEKLLQEQNLDFNLLKPLILETANKAMLHSPPEIQTGPAVRDNHTIMDQHLKMLQQHPEWQELYELISKDITWLHQCD
ncbi:MAG: DUF2520 domain-containing protein [Prolixibacteraceae bacterium]|jgi:predicted short-subunit dehydrogenase-like oxidoreductase (DUF2520 family)|nr:DUF2520 domain-containing protein [Prolixibacteraceae bacterium]